MKKFKQTGRKYHPRVYIDRHEKLKAELVTNGVKPDRPTPKELGQPWWAL